MTREKILITSALPYANGPLHFGHIAGAYLPADCHARFQRLQNKDVLYICGSDEYGIAITMTSERAGRTPKEHVDINHEIIRNFFNQLNISFDHYSRTTWEGHKKPTQQFFLDLLNNGYIEKKRTQQLFSEEEGRFLADRYVVGTCPKCGAENARGDECPACGASFEATDLGNPRSKLTDSKLTLRETEHWFLLLDKFKERLMKWLEDKQWKANVLNFVKSYVEDLRPRAITRDLDWGIPLPLENTEGKVLYVWFDAPIGYISASMEWAKQQGNPERWKDYWMDQNTKLIHFIGKDNLPFHAVIFPAMIMGQNQPYKLVDDIPANEFLTLEGRQFSKSDGWMVDLEDFFRHYTSDQIRYTLAANAPETSDAEFTWEDFQSRCNHELLGKLGNLVNRVLVFAYKQCEGKVPEAKEFEEMDREFIARIQGCLESAESAYSQYKLRRTTQVLMELAQFGNGYFDKKAPWKDAKSTGTQGRMETTIACCLECLKALALIASPVIPTTAQKIWEFLGFQTALEKESWQSVAANNIPNGQELMKPQVLFKRVEDADIENQLEKLKALVK